MNHPLQTAAATLLITLLAAVTNISVAADDEHAAHHPATEAAAGSAATPAPADAMANMKKMQEQMTAIRAAKDPQQRTKLMDEHMQTMQSTMQTMRQGTGCAMMENGGMGSGMMKGGEASGHMNMMQMMMDQMRQHQKAMQGSGK